MDACRGLALNSNCAKAHGPHGLSLLLLSVFGHYICKSPIYHDHWPIFRLTFQQSRPNEAGLNCPSVRRTYVHPSVHKNFFDFHEIWRVGRGRCVMHDGVQYDPIQGQGQGHEPFKVGNLAIFNSYLLSYLQ